MAPVIRALHRRDDLETRLALTGQHTDMVDQILRVFNLDRDYDLDLMKPGQSLYDVGHACMDGLRDVFRDFQPDVTVVQGDTATVFFGALVTFFERGKLAHVEAGLRSHEKWAPFPEEMLRRMTDTISDFCLAPTAGAAENLRAEGVADRQIYVTGNTVVDALHHIGEAQVPVENPRLQELLASGRQFVLLTAHRRESFGPGLEEAFGAVRDLVQERPDVAVLYPVHPNPNVREPAHRILGDLPNIHLVDPLEYTDLIAALKGAALILTDSGGIQEEAPTFGTPVLVLRTVTERPEGVEAGVAELVGTDREKILARAVHWLGSGKGEQGTPFNPYGDGEAGERIADILASDLLGVPRMTQDWTTP